MALVIALIAALLTVGTAAPARALPYDVTATVVDAHGQPVSGLVDVYVQDALAEPAEGVPDGYSHLAQESVLGGLALSLQPGTYKFRLTDENQYPGDPGHQTWFAGAGATTVIDVLDAGAMVGTAPPASLSTLTLPGDGVLVRRGSRPGRDRERAVVPHDPAARGARFSGGGHRGRLRQRVAPRYCTSVRTVVEPWRS